MYVYSFQGGKEGLFPCLEGLETRVHFFFGGGGYDGYIVSRLYIVNKIKTEKKGLKNLNNIFGKVSYFLLH